MTSMQVPFLDSQAPDQIDDTLSIAIIGMNGRFPQAETLEAFWKNLEDGVESISRFSEDELLASGIDAATLP
jgi:acyl transferase domain-containing protein